MEIKKGNRIRKKQKLWSKIIGGLLGALVLFMVILFIVNVISNGVEKKKIEPYGQYVNVDGKKMNVFIQGSGEQTIVLLPGQGTPSPVLDFKLLIDELSPEYKVVAIEPFGYGLSDETEKERTTENIVSEVHEAVQQLGIDRYVLMGHYITGLYGVSYVNSYPDEYTKEQMRLISNQVATNPTMMDELRHLGTNFKNGEQLTYPNDLPVLLFVQSNNENNEQWVPLHEAQVKQSAQGEMIPMEGSHYLHHTKFKEIAGAFKAYMKQIQPFK
ncbi:alpha/beta hydrolase [Paenibacillus sp. FSL L8-0470]|uniref:alpha/beta fold hydrolase n=1 Tax=Paenibacillus sp. FSL L8-0470 TaxID=2954688 RepID=UPI0030FC535F